MSYYKKVALFIGVAGIPEDVWDIIIYTDFIIIQSVISITPGCISSPRCTDLVRMATFQYTVIPKKLNSGRRLRINGRYL